MLISSTILFVLSQLSTLEAHGSSQDGQPEDSEDMMYRQLSPSAFFSMKDNIGPGMGPMSPGMGSMGPSMEQGPLKSGMGPIVPGMRPMGPGMAAMGPGMKPMGPGGQGANMKPFTPGYAPVHIAMGGSGMKPMGPPLGPGMKMPDLMDKPGGKKGYEHFDLSVIDDMSRQNKFKENFALEYTINRGEDDLIIYNLCFCISYIWRRGRESIRKYYHLRDIYSNHLPFEVGYITHVIISKYTNMLELYQYCSSKVGRKKKTITVMHLMHFQETIQSESTSIVHLCNMLHEIKAKYDAQPYNPGNKFDVPPPDQSTTERIEELQNIPRHREDEPRPNLDKGYLSKKIAESHKMIDQSMAKRKKKLQAAREYYKKHGHFPTTSPRTQQPMRLWSPNLDYGWSGEDDW